MEFPMHWLIILVVILVLFGGRKIPELMRGMGEGVRGFKEGMHGANQSQSQTAVPPTQPTLPSEPPADEKKLG
jgi:sec-independent protein translocase protein TatA